MTWVVNIKDVVGLGLMLLIVLLAVAVVFAEAAWNSTIGRVLNRPLRRKRGKP